MGVVPYIGTWIETFFICLGYARLLVVPYIGTWIETKSTLNARPSSSSRTLYRYVD